MEPPIAVDGLCKRYGKRTALDDVTLSVGAGEIVGLLGPNGAGKSTTLSILATLLAADGGTVRVAGHRLPEGASFVRRSVGLVPQQTAVYPALTAAENLRFFASMHGLGRKAAADAASRALSLVGLEGRAVEPVARFSGGMRRRLNLACGILHRPRILLLDEPTVGVDPQSRERIFDAVAALGRDGTSILYSTHYMEEAERVCDRVVLLDSGRVIASGTSAELVAQIGLRPVLHLRTRRPPADDWTPPIGDARVLRRSGAELAIALGENADVAPVLLALDRGGSEVIEVALHTPNLADVFFHLTGRALRDEEGGPAAGV
ncbi:MAG: ABC transporter ATP-binding protein [Candidatus Binatia bacterium]